MLKYSICHKLIDAPLPVSILNIRQIPLSSTERVSAISNQCLGGGGLVFIKWYLYINIVLISIDSYHCNFFEIHFDWKYSCHEGVIFYYLYIHAMLDLISIIKLYESYHYNCRIMKVHLFLKWFLHSFQPLYNYK